MNIVFYDGSQVEQDKVDVLGETERKSQMKGFYDGEGTIYLNMAEYNGNQGDLMETFANELSHYADNKKGIEFDEKRQEISNLSSDEFRKVFERNTKNDDGSNQRMSAEETIAYRKTIRDSRYDDGTVGAGNAVNAQPQSVMYGNPLRKAFQQD